MKNKTYALTVLITTFAILSLLGIVTVFVDPYFHYHKPQPSLRYPFAAQVYTNDGILKNFDYDAVITGTSMTENFYTSQLDEKFNVNIDDLLNKDISEVKSETKSKINITNYINKFFDFITNTVTMFFDMSFGTKIKF